MPDRVRIHDVAAAAGVSVTTVSHALSGRGKVSEETRERVRAAAAELGYAPNRVASALRQGRTDIIGFVSDEIATTPFAGRIVLGAQDAATEREVTLMVVNSSRDEQVERRQIDVLLAQQVDALIYATMFHRPVEPLAIPRSLPLVLVNAVSTGAPVPAIVPNEVGLAFTATRTLLDAGHRRIAHLTIAEPGFGTEGRIKGYSDAMRDAGLTPHIVAPGVGPADAIIGRAALSRALDEDPALTAVFCFNDPMARGAYQVAEDHGLRVPEDLSVIGVDNLEIIAAHLRPALTTLALPHYEMGRWALQEAVRRVEGDESVGDWPVRLDCPLVRRDSVAAAVPRD